MSRTYRYVVFAPGKQPTVEEITALKECAVQAKLRYAVGTNADDGGLAFAFEAEAFSRTLSGNAKFAKLVEHWHVRGCHETDRLAFIKNPAALQPTRGGFIQEKTELSAAKALKRKQQAAQESLGRAGLQLHRTLQQHAWLHRLATVVPYALMGLGGLLVIVFGVYISQRLQNAKKEGRQETIKRVADDAMAESLVAKPKGQQEENELTEK